MQWIPPGTFLMGSERFYREEAPVRSVHVEGFWIDRTPVTNREFARFVEATGYETFAEQSPNALDYPHVDPRLLKPGSAVFASLAPDAPSRYPNRWHFVPGAHWRRPDGTRPLAAGEMEHPVVHVAYVDAQAYAAWAGKDLPTEAEWEYAARGGLDGADYAWGDVFEPNGERMANTWLGHFPYRSDNHQYRYGTSAVGSFPPNGYDLFDMIGNVWEWTSSNWTIDHSTGSRALCCLQEEKKPGETSPFPRSGENHPIAQKVLKGGSHLCAENHCRRYRPAARHAQMIDSPTSHIGFRCVHRSRDLPY